MEKFRDRKFCLLLYPEDCSHASAIELLKTGGFNCAIILHDQDIWTENDPGFESSKHTPGDKKKPHWHVVLKFQNPRWNTSLAQELGIKANYLEKCSNLDSALLYLVHEGYPDKYQYDIDSVEGTLKVYLQKLLLDEDEGSRILRIVDMIDASPAPTYREILVKACKAGLYGEFRRLGSGVKFLIDERISEINADMYADKVGKTFNDRFRDFEEFTSNKGIDNLPPI